MRAGELRHRVQLQTKTVTRNSFSEEVRAWSTLATVWGRVKTLSGDESIVQSQETATLTHEILIRAYAGVSPVQRVLWQSRVFEIHSVVPDERNQQMTLFCSEVV